MPSSYLPLESLPLLLLPSLRLLPGHLLLKISPAEIKVGSVYVPEAAASAELARQKMREGTVLKINRKLPKGAKRKDLGATEEDAEMMEEGDTVFYMGHADEAEQEYVIVKLGQVQGVVLGGLR